MCENAQAEFIELG